jgi:hypothetical protein
LSIQERRAAVAWPIAAWAQQGEQMRRISALTGIADEAGTRVRFDAFREALTGLGWIEGQNIRIDYRWGEGRPNAIRKHAAELAAGRHLGQRRCVTDGDASGEPFRADCIYYRSRSSRFRLCR